MELLWNLLTYLLSLISLKPLTPTGSELTGFDTADHGIFGSFDVVAFFRQLQERLYGCGKSLLDSMPDDVLHPVLDFHEMTWDIFLIMAMVHIMFLTIALRTMCAAKRAVSRMREDGNQKLEMLLAEQSKVQQLQGKIKMLEEDQIVVQNEKVHLELQSKIMQEKLDAKNQCQDTDSALKASGSEHSDKESEVKYVVQSDKLTTKKSEESKKTNDILKIQVEFHKKQAEENLIGTRIAEHALAAERKENANLRRKVIEVSTQLAEIKDPVIVPPLKKDGIASGRSGKAALEDQLYTEKLQGEKTVQLEEKIKKMECDQASLSNEKTNLENLYKILQEKFLIMQSLCQEKDSALQQRLAEEEVEQHVKQIKSAGPKEEVRNFKQRIQEINEKHEKTLDSLKKKIAFHQKKAQENWVVACASERALTVKRKELANLSKQLSEVSANLAGYQEPLVKASSSRSDLQIRPLRKYGTVPKKNRAAVAMVDKSTQAESSDQLERYRARAELAAEKTKVEQLGAKIQAMEEEYEALRKEMLKLAFQNRTFQGKVQSMNELCKQKDQALQQKTAQVDSERRDKELKVKEVLRVHKLKVQAIVEQHQKSELSCKAEIVSLKKSRDKLMKTCASGRAQMTNLCKQRGVNSREAECQRAPSGATPDSFQEAPLEKKTIATQTSLCGSSDTSEKLPNAVEDNQSLYLKKLQLEEEKSQQLEEKIQTLEQERDALESERSQLEDQTTSLQSELHSVNELCQQRAQALQQNTVQAEVALSARDAEIQALALNVRVMGEELESSRGCYKAQMEFQEQQAQENMTKATEQVLVAQGETIATLRNELAEVKAKLAVFQNADSEPRPSCSYQVLPLLLLDSEEVPLLSQTEARSPEFSAPSSSTGSHLSPLLPSPVATEEARPRRSSTSSVDSMKRKGASFLKLFKKP
ncbi:myosin-10-like [Anguilla anguilla]|uniref:myosin-10-like n=1 Tax=Anguilla anguilla TaxID=7936 RepID=UPI0015AD7E77|nr:myosin-10-like [Anguilla anguilla]